MAKIGLHDELSLRPAAYNLESPLIELPLYLGLGVVAGLVAVMFKFFSRKVGGEGSCWHSRCCWRCSGVDAVDDVFSRCRCLIAFFKSCAISSTAVFFSIRAALVLDFLACAVLVLRRPMTMVSMTHTIAVKESASRWFGLLNQCGMRRLRRVVMTLCDVTTTTTTTPVHRMLL